MAYVPWTLCSKQDVMAMVTIPEGKLADFWSTAVEQMIREHLGEPNLGAVVSITNELYNGDGSSNLIVKSPPLKAVTGLTISSQTISASAYTTSSTAIHLKDGAVFTMGDNNVVVSYDSGALLADISPRVRLCAAQMMVAIANFKGREGADMSMVWGDADSKIGNTNLFTEIGLHHVLNRIMVKMLRRSKVRIN